MSTLVVENIENAAGNNPLAVLMSEQATTSGTAVDFTGIPSGVKKITIMGEGVSHDGSNNHIIQLGDTGGIETSGYTGGCSNNNGGATSLFSSTTGFAYAINVAASRAYDFQIILTLKDSSNNTWSYAGTASRLDVVDVHRGAGAKSLSGVLDRIRITSAGTPDTFDAGSVNVRYEY